MEREQIVYSSLLTLAGVVLADPEPMLSRLVRGCIALAFTACVLAVACSHRHANTVKGGELSYMALAMEREHIVYSSLLTLAGAALADPEPPRLRPVRGCIALAFTARVHAVARSHDRLAEVFPLGRRGQLHGTSDGTRANRVQVAPGTGRCDHARP